MPHGDFPCPQVNHLLMVLRIGRNDTCRILFKTAYTVLKARSSRQSPSAYICFRIPLERTELSATFRSILDKRRMNLRKILHRRDTPWFRSVAQESFREQDNRHHVLHGEFTSIELLSQSSLKGMGRHHHDRTLSIASVKGLIKVCLHRFW